MACNVGELCADFSVQSRKTWNIIKRAEKLGLNLSEESITDFSLLELQYKHSSEIQTFKFSKPVESSEGADWEWWLLSAGHFLGLRVQAKKIHSQTLTYPYLNYQPRGQSTRQVDALINKALNTIYPKLPVYVLYNFWNCNNYYAPWFCSNHRRDVRMLGCSIVDARAIRAIIDKGQNRLEDIVNIMYPWSCPLCCQGSSGNTALPFRAFDFLSKTANNIDDFRFEQKRFVIEKAPWYVYEILERKELSEEQQEEIGVNAITIIKEKYPPKDEMNYLT